ncbi:protein FAM204A [Microcaecilia unicolor]|uniref:Protein FAM204A n=1 Tax=Microcaecilia unicolor TaxID=1415580 RepID=A0A6P7Y0Z3_9AMPH|nr:protein FAM204A [Microcaecilia unicolor]
MWSGLLPPGLNESDIDLSSEDDENTSEDFISCTKEEKGDDQSAIEALDSQPDGFASTADTQGTNRAAEAKREGENLACPSGVPADMWNKFQQLQKKHFEIKTQANDRDQGHRRRRRRKDKLKRRKAEGTDSQEPPKESPLDELKQFFGINDKFEPPVTAKKLQKSGLENSIDQAVNSGDIEKAEELSDALATREMGVKIAHAVACRNFMKAKQEEEASQEAQKKRKLAWGFEAKKRWETKSNMGYM